MVFFTRDFITFSFLLIGSELLALIVLNGETLGIVDLPEDAMLSAVRQQIKQDEIALPSSFRFLYKYGSYFIREFIAYLLWHRNTSAPITEKQEHRYSVKDCLCPPQDDSNLPILRIC
jgi:hypothetical protein